MVHSIMGPSRGSQVAGLLGNTLFSRFHVQLDPVQEILMLGQ